MKFDVYEKRQNGNKWIGSVKADSNQEALEKAHEQYGAPIEITLNNNYE